jgi:hypothetical protein
MISHGELGLVAWRKSTRSDSDSGCVSIAVIRGFAAIRDSKDPRWRAIVLGLADCRDLVQAIKDGQYDV